MDTPSGTAASPAKFDPFDIHSTSYKTVNNHPIGVDVLIPKRIKAGLHPLIVRFHGGFLVTGSSLFPNYFTSWILQLASVESAIVVSADYRLLPEANGYDILADLSDLWQWIFDRLPSYVTRVGRRGLEIDFEHILVVGDSSGGYLAVQSVLTQPAGIFKMLVGLYPQLDMQSDFYNTKFEKTPLSMPMLPTEIVDKHVAATKPGTVVSSADPPTRVDLACSIVQNGRMLEFLGSDEVLFPLEMVGKVGSMPPTLIVHGKEDTTVPLEGSIHFVAALKQKHPSTPVTFAMQPGDHGFDDEATLQTGWLMEHVDFIVRHWLEIDCTSASVPVRW